MSEIPQEFIEAHMAVCERSKTTRRKKPDGVTHHGDGAFYRKNARAHRRGCAKRLYRTCIRHKLDPVPTWAEYFDARQKQLMASRIYD